MRPFTKIFIFIMLAFAPCAKAADARTIIAAGAAVTEAIKGLGPDVTERQISDLVYHSVKAQPDAVLQIVHAAVKCTPDSMADEIAMAAVAGIRDPWRHIIYYRPAFTTTDKGGRDFKGDDSKDVKAPEKPTDNADPAASGTALGPDAQKISETGKVITLGGATLGPDSQVLGPDGQVLGINAVVLGPFSIGTNGGSNPNGGVSITLAQAIAETIFDTRPSVNHTLVLSAIDIALNGDPTRMEQIVTGSRGISGVGDAGNKNYANEPRFPRPTPRPTPRPRPTPPPPRPTPPPVSL